MVTDNTDYLRFLGLQLRNQHHLWQSAIPKKLSQATCHYNTTVHFRRNPPVSPNPLSSATLSFYPAADASNREC